jgi:hypothetical protein
MAGTVTGKDARVYIAISAAALTTHGVALWGISDFSVTMDRGTVEQELVGQVGNYFDQGAISIEGSVTNCKFAASGNCDMLFNLVETATYPIVLISGTVGSTNPLKWHFTSAQITNYEVTAGDADTISELSFDFQLLNPYQVSYSNGLITC